MRQDVVIAVEVSKRLNILEVIQPDLPEDVLRQFAVWRYNISETEAR